MARKDALRGFGLGCQCVGCVNGVGCILPAQWDEGPVVADQWKHERVMHQRRLERVMRERERWERQ